MPGVTYTRNADGTLTQQTDGGYKALVIDPDGSFEREMSAPQGLADVYPPQPSVPKPDPFAGMSPEARAAIAGPDTNSQTANPTPQPIVPDAVPTVAPLPGAGSTPKATLVPSQPAAPAMATKSETSMQQGGSTTGLSKEDRAKVEAAGDTAKASELSAIDTEKAAKTEVLGNQQARASQDFMAGYRQQVGALEAQDKYKGAYQEAIDERKAARSTKLDPSLAFGSEKASWGFLAGLEGALAAMDEGITRLQRRGHAPPSDMIEKMVDASLKMQADQRAQRIASAGESADYSREQMLAAQSNVHEAAAQMLEARKMLASSSDQAAFLDAEAAKQRAAADLKDEERAKAVATHTTSTWQKQQQLSTGPAAGANKQPSKAQHDDEANLRQLYRIRDTLRRAEKSGDLAGVVGWQQKLGANSFQDFFGGLEPGQKEALTALQELETGNLMRLVREPNNKNTQNMVQKTGIPNNDKDIPGSLSRLDQLIADQEDQVKNAPAAAPAAAAEAY